MRDFFELKFFAPGLPQPGGSKRGFVNPRDGRVIITEDAKRNRQWRAAVAFAAAKQMEGRVPAGRVPLSLHITFVMARPKSHYRTGKRAGELRPDAPRYHLVKPDATKLLRSTEDALTGIAWDDDCSVMPCVVKVYTSAERPLCGAEIVIRELCP